MHSNEDWIMGRTAKAFGQVAGLMMLSSAALAEDVPGEWRQSVFLYGMGVAIDGDASIGPLSVEVDMSISDVFDSLDMGGMVAYRIENDTWSFTVDATYMDLSTRRTTDQGRAGARLGTEQLTVMGTVGRRVSPKLEALFSLAYFDVSGDIEARVLNQTLSASRSADWVDPLVGVAYSTQISDKWSLNLRGEVGGFGVGSDLTLHGLAKVVRQNSDSFSWYFGYRYIAYDYETGSGINYQRYDLQQHGPGIGIALSF